MKYKKKSKNIGNYITNILKIKYLTKRKRKLKSIRNSKEKHKQRINNKKKTIKKIDKKLILKKIISIAILLLFYLFWPKNLTLNYLYNLFYNKKRVGVVCIDNSYNVGNILVKYSMFKKLEELGFNATIITPGKFGKTELSFINKTFNSNLFLINNSFSQELNESDFDYLIVNSDQTWAFSFANNYYDIAFLRFAKNWSKVKKFVYAASIGSDSLHYMIIRNKEKIKELTNNFTGISFREIGTVKLFEEKMGIKGVFVLDPTLIIDKQYYLNEIKGYKGNFTANEKFMFVYQLDRNFVIKRFIEDSSKKLNYKIFQFQFNRPDVIESFIFGISNSQCVITDSFHGTIFSIMFNKPFISFVNKGRGKARFDSLKEVFNLNDRIIEPLYRANIDINLLINEPNVNQAILNKLKSYSINYLKKNLGLDFF